jgi:hypothetical protein
MEPPQISEDNKLYFQVEPQHTPELISFLRKQLDGFCVDIGAVTVGYSKDTDVFNVPSEVGKEVLAGLLTEFYAYK